MNPATADRLTLARPPAASPVEVVEEALDRIERTRDRERLQEAP